MLKLSHSTLIFISGFVWLGIGFMLLSLGLNFIVESILFENLANYRPFVDSLTPYVGGGREQAILFLIVIALLIGFMKSRFIFSKTVKRSVDRILTLPNPASLSQIYAPSYYILLGSMFLLGYLVRFLPLDVRGVIDVIIGAALINGSVLYFRQAWAVRQRA